LSPLYDIIALQGAKVVYFTPNCRLTPSHVIFCASMHDLYIAEIYGTGCLFVANKSLFTFIQRVPGKEKKAYRKVVRYSRSRSFKVIETGNKLLSLTYKVITTTQPSYVHNLISLQPPRSTRSSSVVTLSRPPTISSLKVADRSFRLASSRLWNQLPDFFRQPRQSCLDSPLRSLVSPSFSPHRAEPGT